MEGARGAGSSDTCLRDLVHSSDDESCQADDSSVLASPRDPKRMTRSADALLDESPGIGRAHGVHHHDLARRLQGSDAKAFVTPPLARRGHVDTLPLEQLSFFYDHQHRSGAATPLGADLEKDDKSLLSPSHVQHAKYLTQPAEHIFRYADAKSTCAVCRKRIGFKVGVICTICRMGIHDKCLSNRAAVPPCQQTCTLYDGMPSKADIARTKRKAMLHHWVDGNFANHKCAQCHRVCGQPMGLRRAQLDKRCSWCKRVMHAQCARTCSGLCDMGTHARLMLSINDVHVNRLASPDDDLRPRPSPEPAYTPPTLDESDPTQPPPPLPPPAPPDSSHSGAASFVRNTFSRISARRKSWRGPSSRTLKPATVNTSQERNSSMEFSDVDEQSVANATSSADVPSDRVLRPEHVMITVAATKTPLLVFVNPKSGGNQGRRVLRKLQWLLNPWQVFDLSAAGPEFGLDLFSRVPNLRILVAGGDGTVGWVLSELDKRGPDFKPPVAVLPLGTGNDLARVLRWGGGYANQSLSEIVVEVGDADEVELDRWSLTSQLTGGTVAGAAGGEADESECVSSLPLDVVNNYFSFGADADAALAFHVARERDPKKFTSRLGNKLYYGMAGGKQIIQPTMKDLYKYVSLECDGKSYDHELESKRLQGVIFLNITSYAGGTNPWGPKSGDRPQTCNDGWIEVVGVTSVAQLARQQVGLGGCVRLCQCRSACITTRRPLPMQIDGEPCMLAPSVINLSFLNRARMLARRESTS